MTDKEAIADAVALGDTTDSSSSCSCSSKTDTSMIIATRISVGLPTTVDAEHTKPSRGRAAKTWISGFFRFVGPGFVMAIAFLDPGNLASDVNQGVLGGYSLMWVTLYATVMAWVIQSIAAMLGLISGRHLAQHCYSYYPRAPRWFLFLMIELSVLACDMTEVIGGAVAIFGLSGGAIPMWGGVLITCAIAYTLLSIAEYVQRDFLQWFMASVLAVLIITFIILFARSTVQANELFKGIFVPSMDGSVQAAVGCVGSVIMPYNLFLGSAIVLTRPKQVKTAMDNLRTSTIKSYVWVETALVLGMSLVINLLAIGVFATSDQDAMAALGISGEVGILDVGRLLEVQYGKAYEYIWYVGLLFSAQASTMTTTYAGSFIVDGFLNRQSRSWWSPYIVRTLTMLPAMAVSIIPTSDGYAEVTDWLNQISSIVVPYAMIPLLLLSCSHSVMGKHVLKWWLAILAAAITMLIIALNVNDFIGAVQTTISSSVGQGFAYTGIALYILSFLFYAVPMPVWQRLTTRRVAVEAATKAVDQQPVEQQPSPQ